MNHHLLSSPTVLGFVFQAARVSAIAAPMGIDQCVVTDI